MCQLFLLNKYLFLDAKIYVTIANPTCERRVTSQWQHGYEEPKEFITELLHKDQIPVVQLFVAQNHSDNK